MNPIYKFCLGLLCLAILPALPALAAQKTAVFPFDLRDADQDGEMVPQYNEDDLRRAKLVADELKALMTKDGRYEVIDLTPLNADIEKASPFDKCDACETPLAEKAGAELAVTGVAHKFSNALISLQLYVRDVKSGEMKKTMSAAIQGNTDELWLHGVRWLWKNRFNNEAKN